MVERHGTIAERPRPPRAAPVADVATSHEHALADNKLFIKIENEHHPMAIE
jgi:hypothetical protein